MKTIPSISLGRRVTPLALSITLALGLAACTAAPVPEPAPARVVPTPEADARTLVDAVLASPELRRRLAAALHPDLPPTPPTPATGDEEWATEVRLLRLEVDALKAALNRQRRDVTDAPAPPPIPVDAGADDVLERWLRRLDRDQELLERQLRRLDQRLDRLERRPVTP